MPNLLRPEISFNYFQILFYIFPNSVFFCFNLGEFCFVCFFPFMLILLLESGCSTVLSLFFTCPLDSKWSLSQLILCWQNLKKKSITWHGKVIWKLFGSVFCKFHSFLSTPPASWVSASTCLHCLGRGQECLWSDAWVVPHISGQLGRSSPDPIRFRFLQPIQQFHLWFCDHGYNTALQTNNKPQNAVFVIFWPLVVVWLH